MGYIWLRYMTEPAILIVASAILIVLPIQLLLCFYAEKILFRLLPAFVFTVTTVFLFAMAYSAKGWDALGYVILGEMSGLLLIFTGLAWSIWAIIKLVKKSRGKSIN